MAFDQATRNRLQRFVNDARHVLEEEFTRQLQNDFGLDPNAGTVAELAKLHHINDAQRETARILRSTLAHYRAGGDMDAKQGLDRIVREQAFTVLNRLAALRMAEARGLLIESVGDAFQAKGFQLYARLAGTGLGETGDAYRTYLFSVFDELSQDLPGLFDRYSPQGRLFPRETALLHVLKLINDADIAPLWSEDETIGWIYQYFNSKEERKAMRDASQAPRNSRELAVRNQFFTPRYVVEFLVDNTLGRLWFNATGGATDLRDRCQYLLVKPDETPEAATKLRDPRTLKLLDPACGSMHFGLYAFDLFVEIYREAWAWEQEHGPGSLDVSTQPQAAFKPLSQTYADDAAFLRDVPRLIIDHNIYGVDIDPRAAQIASLALWLRAQRAWHDAGVKAKDRPLIGRGHVIAATAPPAERELRQQFAASLDQRDAELFEKTLQLLKGLPELGVLLQVERELPNLIRQVYGGKGTGLFAQQERKNWEQAEERLRTALTEFAQASKSTYQGRLFAQDALEGLRLIDLCREVFDVVVMNPPFGKSTNFRDQYLRDTYPVSYYDLYSSFVDRAIGLTSNAGYVGCITSKTFFSTSRLLSFRRHLLDNSGLYVCVDLGQGVLDNATVETAAYVLCPVNAKDKVVFVDLQENPDRQGALIGAIKSNVGGVYSVDRGTLSNFPNASFSSYWGSESLLSIFNKYKHLDPDLADTAAGQMTGDDSRFVRARWEIFNSAGDIWKTFAKGGDFIRYVSDWPLVVDWREAALIEYRKQTVRSVLLSKRSGDFLGRNALVWNRVSAIGLNVRILPRDAKFADKAPAIFPHANPLGLIAILCSRLIDQLCALQNPNRMFEVRDVSALPVAASEIDALAPRAGEIVRIKRLWLTRIETSPLFVCFAEQIRRGETLKEGFDRESGAARQDQDRLRELQYSIDLDVEKTYGLGRDDAQLLVDALGSQKPETISLRIDPDSRSYGIKEYGDRTLSYLVGVVFSRWDAAFATGVRKPPMLDGPFEPLPAVPPGAPQSAIPTVILVDDEGSSADIVERLRGALRSIWGTDSDHIEDDLCTAIESISLREYLRRPSGFFSSHLSRYSEGARKAPIYWPLSTNSDGYTLWVYYPSLTSQTLFTAINDYVEPKLRQVGADVTSLHNKGSGRARDEEKQLEALQAFEQELIELRNTLLKLAPSYKPNHDDGVQITAAPLWPLFRHKPWQKVLKDTWAKLEKGDYDWAHLAMNYWPERVREKCKTDKSLAIAHGLENLYVEPEPKPKKTRAKKSKGDAR